MKAIMERVILAGTMAPSGDNCQPWRFRAGGGAIEVFNIPERDTSLYSWGSRASYIAHGALLENMRVAAADLGYAADVMLFPDSAQPDLIARVQLRPSGTVPDAPLAAAIPARATNRKPYRKERLTDEERRDLLEGYTGAAQVVLVEEPKVRARLGNVAAANEIVLFENHDMHGFFFGHLNWTPAQDDARKAGMRVETLELPPPARLAFHVFKRWNIMRLLTKLGLAKAVALGNSKIYATGAATGAILIPDRSPASYVAAGQALERFWLKATAQGLALQPLTGIPLLMNRVISHEHAGLSDDHAALIAQKYAQAAEALKTDLPIAVMFRIGHADIPQVRTARLNPDVIWT